MKVIKKIRLWLSTNQSIQYLTTFSILCILFIGFMTSRLIFEKQEEVVETKPNESIVVNNVAYQWTQKYVNESSNEVVIGIAIDPEKSTTVIPEEIDIIPQLKDMSIANSEVKVYKGSDNYYLLSIKNLPKNWTTIRLRVGAKNNSQQALMYFNHQSNYNDKGNIFSEKDFRATEGYAKVYGALYEISNVKKNIETNVTKKEEEYQASIQTHEDEIKKLMTDIQYKTEKEKERRESQAKTIRQKQETLKKQIEQLESIKKEYEEQEHLLQKKLDDLKKEYSISL